MNGLNAINKNGIMNFNERQFIQETERRLDGWTREDGCIYLDDSSPDGYEPVPSPFNQSLENAPKVGEIWINRQWETSNQIIAIALNIYLAEWDIIFCELMEDGSQKSTVSSCFLPMFLGLFEKAK
ncbi:hypothetical protein [Nostoc sp. FACHB-888]|uniref:hypothetical protein n=1 Tax=Nostoc sp. FACHB-888 TaxID=2692842 RepID=UPI00168680FE|nr:hypothetical protein [Nostoc sp. FACHB-888]MBD2243214.1 hypothetical protein [Nostoc sp. FACHB-888]